MWGGLTEEKVVIKHRDEDTGEILHLAFSDVLTPAQTAVFSRMTDRVRQSGETDLRQIFSQGVDAFNEEAERRDWTVRAEFWERPRK